MIVICDKAQDIVIPAGLGDNAGVVYEKAGVESLNGQQGDLTLKTVNGTDMLGEGDVAIDTGVESLNGQKGALNLKTINNQEITGEGNIEIQAGGVESLNNQTGALKLKTIDNKDVLGEGNMDILSDYSICMFMMYNLTLSEADKGVDLYKYGIGDDAANLDKYFGGWKTIQVLNLSIKDGASYKVPLTVFWDGDGNRQFRFVCEGYEYTYTSIDANYCDFTSKVKIGGESGLKYFELTDDKAKEAYEEVINHWDSLSGYTGDYVFTYNNRKGNTANYYFVKITHIDDATGNYVLFSCVDTDAGFNYRDSTIKIFSVIVYNNNNGANYNLHTYYNTFTIPTNVSQLTNDSEFQTKSQVDYAIANAISGFSGNQNVIVLDGLTQEERKAVYDKMDKSVPPKEVFKYNGAVSFYTYWEGSNYLKIFFLDEGYSGGRVKQWSLDPNGDFGEEGIGMNYPNFLFLNVGDHAAEGADFECAYTGNYHEFMYRPYTEPNGYFLVLKKGIGDSTKKMVLPLTVLWDKEYDGSDNTPIRIQFTANEKLYTYLHGDADGKWLFESAKPITGGGVQSSEVSNIKVLTQSEYDALEPKDPNTMYCIKGQ